MEIVMSTVMILGTQEYLSLSLKNLFDNILAFEKRKKKHARQYRIEYIIYALKAGDVDIFLLHRKGKFTIGKS